MALSRYQQPHLHCHTVGNIPDPYTYMTIKHSGISADYTEVLKQISEMTVVKVENLRHKSVVFTISI